MTIAAENKGGSCAAFIEADCSTSQRVISHR